ncbi:MAG: MaoC family dehydratase [Bacteroidetes bacterium]|nr:MAG: MaoC family dehydratase [Bacteroidota bacterium]
MITLNQEFKYAFSFTQAEVEAFAKCSGDNNPIHLDANYAANTPFKKPIIHGIFTSSIFSKYFGTINPGEGTIYLRQSLEFLRPMFVDTPYEAQMFVKEIISAKNTAVIDCKIIDVSTGKITLRGEGTLMHKEKIV